MEWREVIEHPSLRDLPFKIETNEWGKIMMTPATDIHGIYQSLIDRSLARLAKEGRLPPNALFKLPKGSRLPMLLGEAGHSSKSMGSAIFFLLNPPKSSLKYNPHRIVLLRWKKKKQLYFGAGAKEFWLCDEYGNMRFFNPQGELKRSELFGEFPEHIDIESV